MENENIRTGTKKQPLVSRGIYRFLRTVIPPFLPKYRLEGTEKLPDGSVIFVGNHAQMNGPIFWELFSPKKSLIWCTSQMMVLREVPDYAFEDFWSGKPERIRWFYKLASYVIAPLSVCVFNNAHTLPVYHDRRIIDTMKLTAAALADGWSIAIFPEWKNKRNAIINEFQTGFVNAARLYYKNTGKSVDFVPFYLAPALKTAYFGNPIRFDPSAPIHRERERISEYLMDEVTRLAVTAPPHIVVPYDNIPKNEYPVNTDREERDKNNESPCS